MKIFVISGKLNGMAKLGGKLQLVGGNFSEVNQIVLYDGKGVKVIEKSALQSQPLEDKYIAIVLLSDSKKVLGVGSSCGKIDIEKIMIEYNLLTAKMEKVNINKENVFCDNLVQKQENFANNNAKIEVNSPKNELLEQLKDCDNDKKALENEVVLQNEACEKQLTNKEFDLADFIKLGLQNDELLDDAEAIEEVVIEKKNETDNCNLQNDNEIKKQNEMEDCKNKEMQEVLLSKNDDIAKGVEFVVEQVKCGSPRKNYYAEIKADLDNFFRSYPKNEELESRVFGSKWVKITADYDYSVGVIFDDDKPSIIAYAEPYEDKSQVDASKLQLGEWLKIEEKSSKNRGYFVFYQNATTGEMILNTGY